MSEKIIGWLQIFALEVFSLFIQMAPYLLLGVTIAGLLSLFFKRSLVASQIGKDNFSSVMKAALFGVPLPLCSCGVIPTISYLKKYGASRSSIVGFLISTPQTGVDSIVATWGLLGPFLAIFRAITAFITGLIGGLFSFLFDNKRETEVEKEVEDDEILIGFKAKMRHFLNFSFRESIDDIGLNFIIGLLIAGLISLMIPDDFFTGTLLNRGIIPMILMILVGIPMYICSTASIPIALALIAKGISPGAAYVFLVAGPATNAASLAVILKILGKKQTAIYLLTIVVGSLAFGLLVDVIGIQITLEKASVSDYLLFNFWDYFFAAIFFALLLVSYAIKGRDKYEFSKSKNGSVNEVGKGEEQGEGEKMTLKIEGMSCQHCVQSVTKALTSVSGVQTVKVNLADGKACITGKPLPEALVDAVSEAGFKVVE